MPLIARFDKPRTLFYIDPPYWGGEKDYGDGIFGRADFQRLAGQLEGLKGHFILSINDVPAIRETFANFHQTKVSTRYSISAKENKDVGELLITNFRA